MRQHSLRNFAVKQFPAWAHPPLRKLEMLALTATGSVLRHLPVRDASRTPPRRAAESLQHYAAEHTDAAAYHELYPAHTVVRRPPRTLGTAPLHPGFATELSRQLPSAGVGVIRGGRVMTSMGAVITPDHQLINDVSHTGAGDNPYGHPLFSTGRLPQSTPVKGRVAVITMYAGNLPGRPYYGHWLWDMLPRLHLLEKSGVPWDSLVVPQVARYERESLKLLGLDKRIIADQDLNLEAEELVVPSLSGFPIGNYSAWACQWLRDRFLPMAPAPSAGQPRRLYISRAKAATRRMLNEAELLSALTPLGFEPVLLEEYSFLDGVKLLRDAEAVVSPHGSNITNLVFCRPGTPVIEIFSPKYVTACHYSMACQAGLDYGYVIGEGTVTKQQRVSENILVNPAHVTALLGRTLKDQ
jgi:capsular polysaccharide biosynthesis protein